MPNMRIVHDNAVDRNLSLIASSTAGSLSVSNLLTEIKSQVWRSTSTTASVIITWTNSEIVSLVALAFCNLTSTSTIRVRGYTNTSDTSPAIDTGVVLACAYSALGYWDWGALPLGVNAFTFTASQYARVWFNSTSVKKLVIDLVDIDNASGYIEASKLICGSYWQTQVNPDFGASIQLNDSTKNQRNDAGDYISQRGYKHRILNLNLASMQESDRARCYDIIQGNGLSKGLFISLFPENNDPALEQSYQIYGKLTQNSSISIPQYNRYTSALTIEEI